MGTNLPAILGRLVSDEDFTLADAQIPQPMGTVIYRAAFPFESLHMKPEQTPGPDKIIGAEIQFIE